MIEENPDIDGLRKDPANPAGGIRIVLVCICRNRINSIE